LQIDSSYSRRNTGAGLGLAIVNRVTEALGGTIEVYSAGEGQGSVFTVDLELERGERILTGSFGRGVGLLGSTAPPSMQRRPADSRSRNDRARYRGSLSSVASAILDVLA
jgi:hypothetical protein